MEFQDQQLQQPLNTGQEVQQTFFNTNSNLDIHEIKMVEKEVSKIQKSLQNIQIQLGMNSTEEIMQLQKTQKQLDLTLRDIKNTQQALEQSQCMENVPFMLH